jgi:hypothetical protein
MEDKGVMLKIFSNQPGIFIPPVVFEWRMVGEWSELRNKVGCGQKFFFCPAWRLRLNI